jgi:hypothetical protein
MMQQAGHAITWYEFKRALKEHDIPKGMVERKLNELLALKQGSDSVFEYAQKFNNLCEYGGYHVDMDEKKMDHFRRGNIKFRLVKKVEQGAQGNQKSARWVTRPPQKATVGRSAFLCFSASECQIQYFTTFLE